MASYPQERRVYSNTEVSLNEGDFRAGGRVGIWLRRR